MFLLCPDSVALIRYLRARFQHADFFPEGGPALVASVPSLGLDVRVVAQVERSVAGGRRVVLLVGPGAGA